MKKELKGFFVGTSVTAVLMGGLCFASNITDTVQRTFRDIKITLNGNTVNPTDVTGKTVEPFIIDGTTYLPVRAVSNALGANVDWDGETSTVILTSEEKQNDADARYQEWLKNLKSSMQATFDAEREYKTVYNFTFDFDDLAPTCSLKINDQFELFLNGEKIADNVLRCYAGYEGNGGPGCSIYYITEDGTLYYRGFEKNPVSEQWYSSNETHKLGYKNITGFLEHGSEGGYGINFIDIDGNIIRWSIDD